MEVTKLAPRKSQEGHVPRWRYRSHKRKVKAIIEGPYDCPVCGKRSLVLQIDRDNENVKAECACGFSNNLEFRPVFQPVDYYGKLVDQYYNQRQDTQ